MHRRVPTMGFMTHVGGAGDPQPDVGQSGGRPGAARSVAAEGILRGLLNVVLGLIACAVALRGDDPDHGLGALQSLGTLTAGAVALWFVSLASLALAVWSIVRGVGRARRLEPGLGRELARAWAYVTVALGALAFAVGGGGHSAESLGAQLLLSWWGAGLLVALGFVVVGVGAGMVMVGATRSFAVDDRAAGSNALLVRLGVAGHVGQGIAVAIVGILLVVAVVTRDPGNIAGLDGSLQSLVAVSGGRLLLYIVAVGLILCGVYHLVRARVALAAG